MPHCSGLVEVSTRMAVHVWAHTHTHTRPLPTWTAFSWHNRKILAKILALALDLSRSILSRTCLGLTSLHTHTGSTDTLAGNTHQKINPENQTESTCALCCTFNLVLFTVRVNLHHCENTWEGFLTYAPGNMDNSIFVNLSLKKKEKRSGFFFCGLVVGFFPRKGPSTQLHNWCRFGLQQSHNALGQQMLANGCLQGTGYLSGVLLTQFCWYLKTWKL